MTSALRFVSLSVVALALFGAGCQNVAQLPQEITGPKIAAFDNVSAKDATAKIQLVRGSTIETRQTFLGFGAKLAAKLAGEGKEGTRVISIERFAPREVASFTWRLSTKEEAESSVKARAEAERLKKTVPEPVMVESVVTGNLDGLNLKDAHTLYLPAYWPETDEDVPSLGTSGIWLSGDVFDDLERNRVSTLDFGILDARLQGAVAKVADFRNALSSLEGQKKKIENRVDVFKIDGEKDLVEWPLKVNGKEVKVEVIRAKSWFGEIVVLNNKQNPLVLKTTLNPTAAELVTGLGPLKALLGYEVTALDGVQE